MSLCAKCDPEFSPTGMNPDTIQEQRSRFRKTQSPNEMINIVHNALGIRTLRGGPFFAPFQKSVRVSFATDERGGGHLGGGSSVEFNYFLALGFEVDGDSDVDIETAKAEAKTKLYFAGSEGRGEFLQTAVELDTAIRELWDYGSRFFAIDQVSVPTA